MRFANDVPTDTRLQFQSYRILPWPRYREVWYGDLRRLPLKKWRLPNLEHRPYTQKVQAEEVRGGKIVRSIFGRYWVDMAQQKDGSQVPGVWKKMWEQIPIADTAEAVKVAGQKAETAARKPVAMANRAAAPAQQMRAPTAKVAPPRRPKP